MAARLLTAAAGIPIFLAVLWLGDWWFFGLILLILILALWELLDMSKRLQAAIIPYVAYPALICLAAAVFSANKGLALVTALLMFPALATDYIIFYPRKGIAGYAFTVWAVAYLNLLMVLLPLRQSQNGLLWTGLLILLIWVSDSSAYFTGMAMGKRPLAPALSPKKTVEGAVGALFFSALAGFLFLTWAPLPVHPWFGGIIGLAVSAAGQIGDLLESGLKRQAKVKDSGKLIPGHGGVLDRFDSLFLAAPVFYFMLLLMIG